MPARGPCHARDSPLCARPWPSCVPIARRLELPTGRRGGRSIPFLVGLAWGRRSPRQLLLQILVEHFLGTRRAPCSQPFIECSVGRGQYLCSEQCCIGR